MKPSAAWGNLNGIVFASVFFVLVGLELSSQIFERGLGHYLKWENHHRPQLGRIWERDRQNLVAQKKIESILSSMNVQERSAESIESFKELFEKLSPAFPQLVSRNKFLDLYYSFPGPWSRDIVSPYELVEIDSHKNWQRVLLTRFGPWITISFIDSQNLPIREVFISVQNVREIQATETVPKGNLEQRGFRPEWIFNVQDYLSLIKSLDDNARKSLLPDPKWFLDRNYHLTRMGLMEDHSSHRFPPPYLLGVEYENDFFTDVLVLPVPQDVAGNLLSQIESVQSQSGGMSATPFQEF